MSVLSQDNHLILKAKKIKYGGQSIDITNDNHIQFNDILNENSVYINTKNNQSNIQIDINQLEGKTLNNFTIKNLRTNDIIISSQIDGDFDLEQTLDEMILNNKINVQNISILQNQVQSLNDLTTKQQQTILTLKNENYSQQQQIDYILSQLGGQNILTSDFKLWEIKQGFYIVKSQEGTDNNGWKANSTKVYYNESEWIKIYGNVNISVNETKTSKEYRIADGTLVNEIIYCHQLIFQTLCESTFDGMNTGSLQQQQYLVNSFIKEKIINDSTYSTEIKGYSKRSEVFFPETDFSDDFVQLKRHVNEQIPIDIETKAQLVKDHVSNNYYSQTQINNKLEDITSNYNSKFGEHDYMFEDLYLQIGNKVNSSDIYSNTQINTLLSNKANSSDVYTKTQIDNLLTYKADAGIVSMFYSISECNNLFYTKTYINQYYPLLSNVYTKLETDNLLKLKLNSNTFYSLYNQNISDNTTMFTNIDNKINTKANITDMNTSNTYISTLQTQMTSVISVNTNQSDLITQIQNMFSPKDFNAMGQYSFTIGPITVKMGVIDVQGALNQRTVYYTKNFTNIVYCGFTSVIGTSNGGNGDDVGYIQFYIDKVIITADYANSGGNESNMYSWIVFGY
ncbi:putative_yadA-like protein [Hexamita inflata]|uniref:YadA-like protein n=1 Tax=Hexamita inflata TaxID=28002 RepID=A0AA86PFV1_9EUKA|nr:putative yadA-like protein [Hexamita inflata]